jgi:hypothetical protein
MADTFVISGLHRKRAHLAGEIEKAQKALNRQRESLAMLDATLRLFAPEGRPDLIPAIRPCSRRGLFFKRGEQPRLCMAAFRVSGKPMTARQVAEYAVQAKGLDLEEAAFAAIVIQVRQTLLRMERNGRSKKIIKGPDAWWEIESSS